MEGFRLRNILLSAPGGPPLVSAVYRNLVIFISRSRADGCTGLAAMLAYNFFLALPLVVIFAISLLTLLPVEDLGGRLVAQLEGVVPEGVLELLREVLDNALARPRNSILLASFVAIVYVSNNAYAGLVSALNRIYGLTERRSWLQVRLRALLLSILAGSLILAAFALVLVVPPTLEALAAGTSQEGLIRLVGRLRWPLVAALLLIASEATFRYAPCGAPRWRWLSPGTLFAALAWLISTLIFDFYVDNFGSYDRLYGTLGTVILLLTWLWISSLVFLLGGEINRLVDESASRWQPRQSRTVGG